MIYSSMQFDNGELYSQGVRIVIYAVLIYNEELYSQREIRVVIYAVLNAMRV